MTPSEIEQIGKEISDELTGLRFGKVFQIDSSAIAIDFFPHSGRYLYLNFGPRTSAAYLIRRKLKELERNAAHQTPFSIALRKTLSGLILGNVSARANGSALQLDFSDENEQHYSILAELGHRPNLFVLDEHSTIVSRARGDDEHGQAVGNKYSPSSVSTAEIEETTRDLTTESLSDMLDSEDQARLEDEGFLRSAADARRTLNAEIRKRIKLSKNLESDLVKHGEPDVWKRYGDLLLSNIGNIRRGDDGSFIVTDYFDPETPEVSIPGEAEASPTETAEAYFKRYAKARNGLAAINQRLAVVRSEIGSLHSRSEQLEAAIAARSEEALANFLPAKKPVPAAGKPKKEVVAVRGARKFISSDGFEILVGKKATDNDNLTFRVARSLDIWLHAADYPGSHVIIRNPGKKELPPKTLLQAAQLAAFYSDARYLPKAAVRYTPRKFVNKPRKAAPGLVSLSSFKTVLVEPKVGNVARGE